MGVRRGFRGNKKRVSVMVTRLFFSLGIVLAVALWVASPSVALAAAEHGSAAHAEGAAAGGSHGGTSHGEGGLNPLSFQSDLALWTGVVFLVVLAVLWKFAWGPIAQGLEQRESRIADEIAAAERTNEDARTLLAQYEKRLAASEGEVREMIEKARRDAEQVGRDLVEKAKAETQVEKERALREIEGATSGALKDLAERSADLAVDLAGKIMQSTLDAKGHSQLIERAVSDFVHTGPNNN